MFGFLKRGPKPPTYLVWQNDASRWSGIWQSIPGRTGDGRLLFIVHFDETLAVLHELLEQDDLIAHELDGAQQPSDLANLPPGIYVVRASALQTQTKNKVPVANTPLKIIAIEPHVLPDPDPRLRSVVKQIRGDVMYEHHASLDDLPVRMFAGQRTLDLLSVAGFGEGDCIESKMVSNAIMNGQTKLAQAEGIDPAVQSLAAWEAQLPDRDGA